MTVFSLQGSRISTNLDGHIVTVGSSTLDVVTRTGTNILEVAYLNDGHPNTVSLSDYNLLFDNVHINDGLLPDQIEFFDLKADDGGAVRVLNFVFASDNGMEEQMYSVGSTLLPNFRSPAEASAFFARHETEAVDSQNGLTVFLANAAGVETKGVFVPIDLLEFESTEIADSFEFFDQTPAAEVEIWQIEQEAVAAQLANAPGQLQTDGSNLADNAEPEIYLEPVIDEALFTVVDSGHL